MKKIVVIPGDGIGSEITESAVEVLKAVSKKFALELEFFFKPAGGTAYDEFGTPLPESTIAAAKGADAVLFGAVGGDKWNNVPADKRPEKAILGLRKSLGLYANLRPVKVVPALTEYSPLKPELVAGADMVIVRELVGGIYFGERCESEMKDGAERAWDLENYSVPEVTRIAKLAFDTAKIRRGKLTSVDKANVLATSRLWRRTVTSLAADYPEVELNHLYVDNCAMQIAANPKQFDVIVTGNLFGDILSDEAAVVGGSIGMMPSASIGEETSLYEPIHGSAPDIAGKGIANPMGTILSAAMLLRYSFGLEDAALTVERAVDKTIADNIRPADICAKGKTAATTKEVTAAVIARI